MGRIVDKVLEAEARVIVFLVWFLTFAVLLYLRVITFDQFVAAMGLDILHYMLGKKSREE